jgi:hypothetical protein
MAVSWQLNDSHRIQIFKAVPLDSYVISDQQFFNPKSHLKVGYSIFQHYLLTDMIFRRNIFVTKRVFFFIKSFSEIFFINKKFRARITKKYPQVFMSKSRFSCQIYTKPEFSWQIFEKLSNTKFHEIPSVCTDGQRDMTKLNVAFRNWTYTIRRHLCPFLQKNRKCQ